MKEIMIRIGLIYFTLYISISSFGQQQIDYKEYKASNPSISVIGRTYLNEAGDIEFDWPGISISARFTGTSCAIKMDDTNRNFYNIFIDELPIMVMEVHSDTVLILAKKLSEGEHLLRFTKRTEGNQGKSTFKGLLLSPDGKLIELKNHRERNIEFIGNSITCGYGVEGKNKNERFLSETEDNYKSYAPIISRSFNADYHLIAHSGQGVARNYGDKKQASEYTMPDRYSQVFDMQKEPLWDFNKWKPDIVVINLGTNDFSTRPYPSDSIFIGKYIQLIRLIRVKYDSIPVFCIVGPMIDEPCYSYVKKMVEINRTDLMDQNVYFIGIPKYLLIEDMDLGSDWHPNYIGQKKMANLLVPVISSVTGWNYGDIK